MVMVMKVCRSVTELTVSTVIVLLFTELQKESQCSVNVQ